MGSIPGHGGLRAGSAGLLAEFLFVSQTTSAFASSLGHQSSAAAVQ